MSEAMNKESAEHASVLRRITVPRIRLWGLISAAGFVAGTASILGFFGPMYWLFDLCSHFRVQYGLGLAAVALLLLIPGQRRAAAVYGALAVLSLGIVASLYVGKTPMTRVNGPSIRAMLANVNTYHGNAALVEHAIRRFDPDILVLEEVNDKWLRDLGPVLAGYGHFRQQPREDNFGIALFSKFPFTQAGIVTIGEAGVPSVAAEIKTPQGLCTVLATHPIPPGGRENTRLRDGQLAELPQWVHRATSPVLMFGDLNVTPWSLSFRRLLRESGLVDSSQGFGVQPTWPTSNPLLRIPIDHCLHSPGIAIAKKQIGPNVGSDHFPVIVDIALRSEKD